MSDDNIQSIDWDSIELETVNPSMTRKIVTGENTATCTSRSRR
jgi:hypothetical protein